MADRQIRVVLAKVGLDGHDRGVRSMARALRDAGMEVIYTGLHRTPDEVVAAAVQEDADFIGISLLSGAHMVIVPRVLDLLRAQAAEDIVVFVGGVIPARDIGPLKELGVAEIFPQDTPTDETIAWLRSTFAARASQAARAGPVPMSAWPTVYDERYLPPDGEPYWFRELETEPPERREARILERLQAQVRWAYEHSAFYRRKWDQAGVGPSTLRWLDDLNGFPVVTKAELRADQAAQPPFGSYLCVDHE